MAYYIESPQQRERDVDRYANIVYFTKYIVDTYLWGWFLWARMQ